MDSKTAGAELREVGDAILSKYLARDPGLIFASLSTTDGRSVAFADKLSRTAMVHRIAAMTASFLALSESFAKEALAARCTHGLVAIELGTLVVVRVPTEKKLHTMSLCADSTLNTAMALRAALDAAEELAKALKK